MRFRSGWLPAAAAALLLCPGLALAQGSPTEQPITPGATTPAGTSTGRTTGAPGAFRAPSPIRPGEPISVLVFPFGFGAAEEGKTPAEGAPAGLSPERREEANALTAMVKAGFLSTPAFSVVSYHPQSSLILRARKDDILRPNMIDDVAAADTGLVDVQKARNIAYRLGIQTFLVGTIDETLNTKTNSLELTLEAQLLNSTTGEVIRSAAVSGAATGAEGVPVTALIEAAARDASQKVFPAMGIQLVPLKADAPPANGKSGSKSKSQPKKADSGSKDADDKQARKDAEEQAKLARRAEETARKQAEEVARNEEKARREAAKNGASAGRAHSGDVKLAVSTPAIPVVPVAQNTQPPAAPAAPAAAPVAARPVQGTSSATGEPIPYGYALGENKEVLPKRNRSGVRVPAWLGVAAFLTGISFLL